VLVLGVRARRKRVEGRNLGVVMGQAPARRRRRRERERKKRRQILVWPGRSWS
jgi:hypothetical protein